MERIYKIYKITNSCNNKVYIGVTNQEIESRLIGHISKAEGGSQYPLHKAMMELGKDKFKIDIIDVTMDIEKAPELEKKYIKLFQSNDPNRGYNSTAGGEYYGITEAMRLAMSVGQQGCVKPRLRKGVLMYSKDGKFIKEFSGMTEASKETGISRAAILRILKKEIKRGSKSNPYLWLWSADYEEIPEKIDPKTVYTDVNFKSSLSKECIEQRNKYLTTDGNLYKLQKAVIKYDTNGNVIKEYPSISEAARDNNMACESIRLHLRGMYDYSNPKILKRLKYIWKYKNNVEVA